jgi:hypothetical protein
MTDTNQTTQAETAEETTEASPGQKMARTLDRYKAGYVPCVASSGAASQNNGDEIAGILAGMTPEATAALADAILAVEAGTHAARYAALNPGQIRMNSGNRIRAAHKRGDATTAEIKKAAKKAG